MTEGHTVTRKPPVTKVLPGGSKQPLLQCCGFGMIIPDPKFSIPDPGSLIQGQKGTESRIRICNKKFTFFKQKKIDTKLLKYDPRCLSRIPRSGSGIKGSATLAAVTRHIDCIQYTLPVSKTSYL